DRENGEDPAAPPPLHGGQEGADQVEGAAEVRREHGGEVVGGQLVERGDRGDPRRRDQSGRAPPSRLDLARRGLDRSRIADVDREREAVLDSREGERLAEGILAAAEERERKTAPPELERDLAPDPGAGAGDHGGAARGSIWRVGHGRRIVSRRRGGRLDSHTDNRGTRVRNADLSLR